MALLFPQLTCITVSVYTKSNFLFNYYTKISLYKPFSAHVVCPALNAKPVSLTLHPALQKHTVCRSKEDNLCFHPSWRMIKLKQISSTVHGQVALADTAGLRAIKLQWRWRAFRSYSCTSRSNGDKWDVTALVKQGYNLSKSNIICDPLWHPPPLFLPWHLNTVIC